jgi:hypothetical protein
MHSLEELRERLGASVAGLSDAELERIRACLTHFAKLIDAHARRCETYHKEPTDSHEEASAG